MDWFDPVYVDTNDQQHHSIIIMNSDWVGSFKKGDFLSEFYKYKKFYLLKINLTILFLNPRLFEGVNSSTVRVVL